MGATEGPALSHTWIPGSLLPPLLPWLALLAFFLMRSNRTAQAGWIVAPVAIGFVAYLALNNTQADMLPSDLITSIAHAVSALAFGLAALWLVSAGLAWKNRFLVFLAMAATLAVMGGFTFVVLQGWDAGFELLGTAILAGFGTGIITLALTLAGLILRRRYAPLGLTLWCVVLMLALSALFVSPFFVFAMLQGADAPFYQVFVGIGILAAFCFAVLLPFLVLSFANPFYRNRLQGLLHLGDKPAPPLMAAVPATEAERPIQPVA